MQYQELQFFHYECMFSFSLWCQDGSIQWIDCIQCSVQGLQCHGQLPRCWARSTVYSQGWSISWRLDPQVGTNQSQLVDSQPIKISGQSTNHNYNINKPNLSHLSWLNNYHQLTNSQIQSVKLINQSESVDMTNQTNSVDIQPITII